MRYCMKDNDEIDVARMRPGEINTAQYSFPVFEIIEILHEIGGARIISYEFNSAGTSKFSDHRCTVNVERRDGAKATYDDKKKKKIA